MKTSLIGRIFTKEAAWAGVAIAALGLAGCATKNDTMSAAERADKYSPGFSESKAIAEEGFIYGLPLVMNYVVNYQYWLDKNSGQYKCPMNELFSEHRVFTYKDTAVVTPNSDTPYSFVCLDLRAEPYVLSVPAVDKDRYYSLQFTDWNTFNYGYVGTRATGDQPGDYLVVGPTWNGTAPAGIKKVYRSSTDFTLVIYRTQLFGPDDMPNVEKIQSEYKVQPLSAYTHTAPPPAAPPVNFPAVDEKLAKENFFEYLDFVLQFAPPATEEKGIRSRLAKIGVGAGKKFNFKDLDLEHKLEIGLGMKAGMKKVVESEARMGRKINGWRVGSAFGDREFFNGNWLLRAAAAKAGIYGNDAVEAMYPMTRHDGSNEPLNGNKHQYTLTFPANAMPPVNAFWSVTMYDGKSQLLIQNPLNRYLINSPMLPGMKKNADGSLTLYIQRDSPGPDRESNWLPAPDDYMYLVMRLYWPKTQPPSILPPGEGTWKPPGIVKVR